jgi:hypothetical protein
MAFLICAGRARLDFSYCMLFWPLFLDASLPCCNILDSDFVLEFYAVQIFQYPKKICPWIYSIYRLRSYHYLPMLVVYPKENFVVLWHLFCGTRILTSNVVSRRHFLSIQHLITLRNGRWSLVQYSKIYPRERPGTHCIGDWVGPLAFDPQIVQPATSRCTDWAIPAHNNVRYLPKTPLVISFSASLYSRPIHAVFNGFQGMCRTLLLPNDHH